MIDGGCYKHNGRMIHGSGREVGMSNTNPYEQAGRMKKVLLIVPNLIRWQIKASDVEEGLDVERFWSLICNQLKLDHVSMDTRRMVLDKMRETEGVKTDAE